MSQTTPFHMPELNKPAPELGIKRKSNSIAFVEGGLSAYKKIMTNLDSTKESKIPEKINREGAFDCSEDILNCIVSVPTEYPTFTEKKLLKADPFGQERKPTHSVPELNKGIGYGSFAVFEDQVNGKAQNSIEASNLILPNNQLPVFNTSCGAQLNLLRNMNYISDPLANAYGMTKSVSNSYENQSMPTDDSNGSFNGANFGVSNIFGSSQVLGNGGIRGYMSGDGYIENFLLNSQRRNHQSSVSGDSDFSRKVVNPIDGRINSALQFNNNYSQVASTYLNNYIGDENSLQLPKNLESGSFNAYLNNYKHGMRRYTYGGEGLSSFYGSGTNSNAASLITRPIPLIPGVTVSPKEKPRRMSVPEMNEFGCSADFGENRSGNSDNESGFETQGDGDIAKDGKSDKESDTTKPRRQKLRFSDDLYTPMWVRNTGQLKEGFCDTCSPGKWLQLKNSAYWYHKQFYHGISSVSGKPFVKPLQICQTSNDTVEGLCHQCHQWIVIATSKRQNSVLWFRHAHKCHVYHKPKTVEKPVSSLSSTDMNNTFSSNENKMNDLSVGFSLSSYTPAPSQLLFGESTSKSEKTQPNIAVNSFRADKSGSIIDDYCSLGTTQAPVPHNSTENTYYSKIKSESVASNNMLESSSQASSSQNMFTTADITTNQQHSRSTSFNGLQSPSDIQGLSNSMLGNDQTGLFDVLNQSSYQGTYSASSSNDSSFLNGTTGLLHQPDMSANLLLSTASSSENLPIECQDNPFNVLDLSNIN